MITIPVKHIETHWTCGDGCCDNYEVTSEFMYKDKIYQFESGAADANTDRFLKEVIGIVFEEEIEYYSFD